MRAQRYGTFSRDETEWGAFGDPHAAFGALPSSQSVLRAATPTGFAAFNPSTLTASQSVLRGISVPLSAPPSTVAQRSKVPASAVQYDQNTVRGAAPPSPASAPSSGAPTSLAGVMAQAMQAMQPQQITLTRPAPGTQPKGAPNPLIAMLAAVGQRALPNAPPLPASVTNQVSFAPLTTGQLQTADSRIQVNPAAGTKALLPNILASVAHATLPSSPPLPASVTKQVQIVPSFVPSTATVSRAAPPAAKPAAAKPAAAPAAALPPSTIAVANARRAFAGAGKGVYTGAQQPSFLPVSWLPAGLVQRAAPNPSAPTIDVQGVLPFLTWVVNNAGMITEGANPLDRTTPQWWVYASGQVNRVG